MASQAAGPTCRLAYLETLINVVTEGGDRARVWLVPMKQVVRVAAYVDEPKFWVKRLQEFGLPAHEVRDDRGVQTSVGPMALYKHGMVLSELIADAFAGKAGYDQKTSRNDNAVGDTFAAS
ncbi:MAG: hypothetical protein H0T51_04630 [Pirellulales bacterium]|nr:hypothetical protein [Pirellulales bacterium]